MLRNIENVQGSIFADSIEGDAGANQLEGEAGNDTLTGGAGNDSFLFPGGLRRTEEVAATELDLVTDFAAGDRLVFDTVVNRVGGATTTLLAGQFRIDDRYK